MNPIITDKEIEAIDLDVFRKRPRSWESQYAIDFARAIEQAILNKMSKQEPFGYYENGRWSIVTDGGPEGYQLVPIEPTEAMIQAGKDVPCEAKYGSDVVRDSDYVRVFKAMLAATRSEE